MIDRLVRRIRTYLRHHWRTDGIFVIAILFINSSVFASYVVPSGSMKPTIQLQDRVFVNKLAYRLKIPFTKKTVAAWSTPQRGDIIAFKFPNDENLTFTKRVVGVAGDRIAMRKGVVSINGIAQRRVAIKELGQVRYFCESFVDQAHQHACRHGSHRITGAKSSFELDSFATIQVPEGHLFVLGDNRNNSSDSRVWGTVPIENVEGRLAWRWFAISPSPFDRSVIARLGKIN